MTAGIQDLIKKLLSLIKDIPNEVLKIHREYLPEFFNGNFYTIDKKDSLPNLDNQIALELAQNGINVRYKREAIYFIKVTFPNRTLNNISR